MTQLKNSTIANNFTIPVELATFSATADGDRVTLDWVTASETNNAGFDVERSTDGETFAAIGYEAGRGTTTEAQRYRFVDATPPFARTLYYRLRQVDTDGTDEYSDAIPVRITPDQLELLPSAPNPFADRTRLRYRLPETGPVRLEVFDLLGRRVATLVDGEQEAGPHETMLQGARLASGAYFVRLTSGDRSVTQQVRIVR